METRSPVLSGRPYAAADSAAVLELFTEPDFFYRTAGPDTLSEYDVHALLADDTRVLLVDGRVTGLYSLEATGSANGCHYELHLRLSASAPDSWWEAAYEDIVASVRARRELIRLVLLVGDYDEHGLRIAKSLGLTEEGTLKGVAMHAGRRGGYVYFSRIWAVHS
jgi:hypothetical protein